MAIVFENIDTGETVSIDRKSDGKWFQAKLQAAINSSNLGINHDRGQDFGWRLAVDQRAILDSWKEDGRKVAEVSEYTKVPVDSLSDSDFLSYMLYQQELGQSEKTVSAGERERAEAKYRERVAAAKEKKSTPPSKK